MMPSRAGERSDGSSAGPPGESTSIRWSGNGDHSSDHLEGPSLTLEASDLRRLGDLFRLLGDRTRLAILRELTGGEINVGTLCDILKLPQPTVSHHLSLLRVSGLIDNRRAGKQVFYRLNGRVSPAALPADETIEATKAGKAIGHDDAGHLDATGIQIIGEGFAVQIVTGGHLAMAGEHKR